MLTLHNLLSELFPKPASYLLNQYRQVFDAGSVDQINLASVSKEPCDEDMEDKYATHLQSAERFVIKLLLSLRIERPQKVLWIAFFLLLFGLSFMAELLQTLPPSKAKHAARRSDGTTAEWVMYGWGLPIARGAAQAIKVIAMVTLFPVTRSLLTFLRSSTVLKYLVPFDNNLKFHRFFGYSLFLFSWIHAFAHVANSVNQTKASSNPKTVCSTKHEVETCYSPYEMAFGENKYGHRNSLADYWRSETAVTGVLMLVILCIGYPCAVFRDSSIMKRFIKDTSFIGKRLYSFTWFFFSHQFMTISFYMALVLHPLPGSLRSPRPHSSTTWVYVLIGLLAYAADRFLRLYRQATWETTVLAARIMKGGVLELKLKKPRNSRLWRAPQFSYKPGQYAYLNVPQVSWAEWHPFTITSVPSDNFIMFHIKSAGDWTISLHDCISKHLLAASSELNRSSELALNTELDQGSHLELISHRSARMLPFMTAGDSATEGRQVSEHNRCSSTEELFSFFRESEGYADALGWPNPIIHIDGPCGAPAQNYKDYKVLLLVGGNIGVTPFISILRNLLTDMERNRCSNCGECDKKHIKHKRVYFFWTVRDEDAVQYFHSTFAAVKQLDTHGVLDIQIHLTSRVQEAVSHDTNLQTCSNLGLTVHPGRPDWRMVFQTICEEHPKETVGVFCCGPLSLTQDLKGFSREYSKYKSIQDNSSSSRRKGRVPNLTSSVNSSETFPAHTCSQ